MTAIGKWLESLGLGKYAAAFAQAEIDLDVLADLTETDLEKLGIPLGPRKKLLKAIAALDHDGKGSGGSQGEATTALPRAGADAERRQLTMLFGDMVGSTALSQGMDPEALREIIRGFQDAAAKAVASFDGYVAKFMGDGVLAYFGWPRAHEDDAERAVRAGLELVDAVARLETGGRPLAARVGIATGLVVVGDMGGSGDANAVVGETPNLAARLQGEAPPNTVVIAPATRRLAGDWFTYEELGARALKGIAEPVVVTKVVAARSAESRFSAIRTARLTRFVGRSAEVALLSARWRMARHSEGQVVVLSAEAGVGKSRIAEIMRSRVGSAGVTWLRYQCSPHHTSSALFPAIEHLRSAASIATGDSTDERLAKLAAVVGEPALPLLAALLGIPTAGRFAPLQLAPDAQKSRTLGALVDQLSNLSERAPVFFLVEDVHWIDPTTRELLDRIVAGIPKRRILMLVTARPEFQNPWGRHPHVTTLSLNRLGQRDCAEMIAEMPGAASLPSDVVAAIVDRADGVPLFIEELTKSAIELGASRRDAVPSTLQDSLHARLNRLAAAKQVAQVAAAVGRAFDYRLIAELAEIAEPLLVQSLEQLEAAGLLFRRGAPPDATYTFKHALIRDAAYQSLLRNQQARLNARIVDVLERGGFEQATGQPELLAHYAFEAGDHDRAARYWHRAGENSLHRGAVAEASEQFVQSLASLAAPGNPPESRPRRQLTLSRLGVARMHNLGWSDPLVRQTFEEARDLARELKDDKARIPPLIGLWAGNLLTGRFTDGRLISDEVFEVAQASGDEGLLLQAHHAAWPLDFLTGSFQAAQSHLAEGLALYDEIRHREHKSLYFGHDPASCGFGIAAIVDWAMGRLETAICHEVKAIEHSRKIGHPPSLVHALDTIGWGRAVRDDQSALEVAEEGLQLAERYQIMNYVPNCQVTYGWGLVKTGRAVDLGLQQIDMGIRRLQERGTLGRLAGLMVLQVDARLAAGFVDACLPLMEQVLELLASHGECCTETRARLLHGRLLQRLGRDHEAGAAYEGARRVARRQQAHYWELVAATEMVRSGAWVEEPARLLQPIIDRFTEGHDSAAVRDAKSLL